MKASTLHNSLYIHVFQHLLLLTCLIQIWLLISEPTSLYCPQDPRKPEWWGHLHPPGLLRVSRTPGASVPVVLSHLHGHGAGEPGHGHDHQEQPQTPHPHVLFSQPLILCWFLLLYGGYAQTVGKLGCGRQDHLLHRMLLAVLLGLHICGDRDFHVGSDGLWPICGGV